ncbi:helix-turn-helix transcriptional regulator [Halosolutus gelatinilyticus]|uniref:helix-turn-helix transcriptional regulator n=1 Tax=Halosolutus gelatinilyticus TaxID=2931975 RepID=UPI001FF435EC|nr:hypothetical protein [Halosolutus gelatinilyticus]
MRVSTAVTLALAALLTTSFVGAVVAAPASSQLAPEHARMEDGDRSIAEPSTATISQPSAATPDLATAQSSPDAAEPKQVIRISVAENGDATWSIESRFLLRNDDEEDAFTDYANEVRNGKRDVPFDLQQFETFRRAAQQETGREMALENASWDEPRIVSPEEAGIEGTDEETDSDLRVGIISYSFTWTNFAEVDDDRIYFGDAFRSDDDSWLSLTDDQRLVIEYPSGYALETATTLKWDGPYQFSEDEIEIVFVRSASPSPPPVSGIPNWSIAALVALVFAVGAVSYLFARRRSTADSPPADLLLNRLRRFRSRRFAEHDQDGTGAAAAGTDGGSDHASPAPAVSDDDLTIESGTRLEFEEEEEVDPELLSDEERVHRLLEHNGGRMKQATIVKETGWSNAKVSQLLSKMDDDGEIEKLRIGRENLITLPEVDPTEVD